LNNVSKTELNHVSVKGVHAVIAYGRVRRLGAACLALVLVASRASAQNAALSNPQAIRVAVEGAYPPFNFIDQNNELQGFEVDLLKALCEVMKARCSPVPHEWDGIVRGLLNHEYDAIMSSLEITERRKRRIAFSRRYYRVPPALIGRKDADLKQFGAEALAGKRIGAVDRSEHATYIQSVHKGAELRTYGKLDEANLDLLTGRLDYVIGDKLALTQFLSTREGSCCRLVADVPADPAYFGHGIGIGLRREDEVLKLQFDRAIAKLMADGTYDRIREKYFPFDLK
jgi:polar amino acid transport system substrate-binding protein